MYVMYLLTICTTEPFAQIRCQSIRLSNAREPITSGNVISHSNKNDRTLDQRLPTFHPYTLSNKVQFFDSFEVALCMEIALFANHLGYFCSSLRLRL